MMNEVPIHTKIKPAQHPDSIRGESQGAKSARAAMTALYVAEGRIRDMHSVVKDRALLHQKQFMANLPRPPDGKHKTATALMYDSNAANHVIDSGKPIATSALKISDAAIATITDQVKHLDATIDQKITAGKNSTRGPEIRAWAAKQESPFLALGQLFQKADENQTLIAEVLLGENFLSGITPENKAALRSVAANVLAGPEVEARAETKVALDHLVKSAASFGNDMAEVFNGLASPDASAIEAITKRGDDNG